MYSSQILWKAAIKSFDKSHISNFKGLKTSWKHFIASIQKLQQRELHSCRRKRFTANFVPYLMQHYAL